VRVGLGDGLHRGKLAARDRELAGVIGDLEPRALGGDADGDDLVPVPVDHPQDVAAAEAGDLVLRPAATEHDSDPDLPPRGVVRLSCMDAIGHGSSLTNETARA
jgi:hypothetical protein